MTKDERAQLLDALGKGNLLDRVEALEAAVRALLAAQGGTR